jgi:hypothetical protein
VTCQVCFRRRAAVLTYCGRCAYELFHGLFGTKARQAGEGADPS